MKSDVHHRCWLYFSGTTIFYERIDKVLFQHNEIPHSSTLISFIFINKDFLKVDEFGMTCEFYVEEEEATIRHIKLSQGGESSLLPPFVPKNANCHSE